MNRSPRVEAQAAASYSVDDAIRRKRERAEARRAELVAADRIDPDCRFARDDIDHECENSDGQPRRPGSSCHYEAHAQLVEQAVALREAEVAAAAALPVQPLPYRGPVYRLIDLADEKEA